ncbi:hypothetical protein EV138_6401 [Kribbella voronezhensis]|uniref:Hpr(Ser) kinase/phosphatase n=1 Tax=Kribbella voronezhensis TaxID=2512212 RepID=A0A4R7SZF4_9ACTN|nr:hypothetical protein [Kribbella voronezhensis]TDU83937.1 hypothetical protein EV138_6401 [Kribbella voronezhensis]
MTGVPITRTLLHTAGQRVAVEQSAAAVATVLAATGGGESGCDDVANLVLSLERSKERFDTSGCEPVTRGVWATGRHEAIIASAGGSGFSQLWSIDEDGLRVISRWTPSAKEAAAARLLPARHHALTGQVLVHYPALWLAMQQGLAPLHVSVVRIAGVAVLLAGPGGVGKSSLVSREMAAGGRATCDNLAACDGTIAYGLAEPIRLPAELTEPGGRRTYHGRREHGWETRLRSLRPELIVVLRRGLQPDPRLRPITESEATRAIVAGTYAAGELLRFWPIAAALAMATGCGPAHPPVQQVAATLAARLPCLELQLGRQPGAGLTELLHPYLDAVHSDSVS